MNQEEKNKNEEFLYDALEYNVEQNDADDSSENVNKIINKAFVNGQITDVEIRTRRLEEIIDWYPKMLNDAALTKDGIPVKTPTPQFRGFIAEKLHAWSYKKNSLINGAWDCETGAYTGGDILPDGTKLQPNDPKVDIVIESRKNHFSKEIVKKEYQSKIHNDEKNYDKSFNKPKYKDVEKVGGPNQNKYAKSIEQTNNGITTPSDEITSLEKLNKITDEAKAQESKPYENKDKDLKEMANNNLKHSVIQGAKWSFAISTISEIINMYHERKNLDEEKIKESFKKIIIDTGRGGLHSGLMVETINILNNFLNKTVTNNSIETIPALSLVSSTEAFCNDLYKCFIKNELEFDDVLCNSVQNTYDNVFNFGGNVIGSTIGGKVAAVLTAKEAAAIGAGMGSTVGPLGTIIGGILGGFIFTQISSYMCKIAKEDGEQAYIDSLKKINKCFSLDDSENMLYFIDNLTTMSEFKLSFKDLMPCHNIFSDISEYQIRKNEIKRIHTLIENAKKEFEKNKEDELKAIQYRHLKRIKELKENINSQKNFLTNEHMELLDTYVRESYEKYISNINTNSFKGYIDYYKNSELVIQKANGENKERILKIINSLDISDFDSRVINIYIKRIKKIINDDNITYGKQYISMNEIYDLMKAG